MNDLFKVMLKHLSWIPMWNLTRSFQRLIILLFYFVVCLFSHSVLDLLVCASALELQDTN